MAEVEATIPENSEPQDAPEEQAPAVVPSESQPEEPPKRGRGRPAGAKDKAPRATKPKVRVEPIPKRQPAAATPEAKPAAVPAEEPAADPLAPEPPRPPVADEAACCRTPEPPSPRTLYRQTSAQLLNLRDVMNSQKRASAAERYTSRLHAWPVV
jgi:hypothetical protein